ncbi:MAG: helical backbone metal receptor [Bacteroidia bacterium]
MLSVLTDRIHHKPGTLTERIISLVPSQTELLADLGLSSRIAGITRFCVYPPEVHISVPRVGGTKSIDIERIEAIKPDLIIANKEENTKEIIELLRLEISGWVSEISTYGREACV